MANSTNINSDVLHELRSIARTLKDIHKDLTKLNSRFFIVSAMEEPKEEENEQPT